MLQFPSKYRLGMPLLQKEFLSFETGVGALIIRLCLRLETSEGEIVVGIDHRELVQCLHTESGLDCQNLFCSYASFLEAIAYSTFHYASDL